MHEEAKKPVRKVVAAIKKGWVGIFWVPENFSLVKISLYNNYFFFIEYMKMNACVRCII